MGVRNIVPDSVAFTVELRVSTVKHYRVRVTMDLQERLLIMSAGILRDVSSSIETFIEQLSEIASNQLALLKWDGTSDLITQYQLVRVLPGCQADRSIVRFNIVLGDTALIHLEELASKTIIQL